MDDVQVDEADMAAMMGFGAFGDQTQKKRKLDLVSVDDRQSLPVANNKPYTGEQSKPNSSNGKTKHESPAAKPRSKNEGLANAVRNSNGDMAYFLPSFIEDPWAHLMQKPKT